MVSRKVPVPRAARPIGNAARPVSRPGVNSDGASNFQSPYQPPAAGPDLMGDIAALDPDAWHPVMVAGRPWRTKIPTPNALGLLAEIVEHTGGAQVQAVNMFLAHHMHPDDLGEMLCRMTDPDDDFGADEYQQIYRAAVTCGTARPFSLWSPSSAPLRSGGVPYGLDSR